MLTFTGHCPQGKTWVSLYMSHLEWMLYLLLSTDLCQEESTDLGCSSSIDSSYRIKGIIWYSGSYLTHLPVESIGLRYLATMLSSFPPDTILTWFHKKKQNKKGWKKGKGGREGREEGREAGREAKKSIGERNSVRGIWEDLGVLERLCLRVTVSGTIPLEWQVQIPLYWSGRLSPWD